MMVVEMSKYWKSAEVKKDKGQTDFIEVDNPGKWTEYTFYPKFNNSKYYGGEYDGNTLPARFSYLLPSPSIIKRGYNRSTCLHTHGESMTVQEIFHFRVSEKEKLARGQKRKKDKK